MSTKMVTELQIVEKPALTVVGLMYHGRAGGPEIPQLWDNFDPRMGTIPQAVNPAVCYGVCRDMDMATGEFDYLAAVEVTADAPVPAGMVRWEVPAATYAVFPTTLSKVGDTYKVAQEQSIPAAGYHHAMSPDLELYDEHFDPTQPESILYVYIPVEK